MALTASRMAGSGRPVAAGVATWSVTAGLGLAAAAAGVAALALWLRYPVGQVWLAVALAAYAALIAWRPEWWLAVLPAALPLLDFAPWTGWIFLDAFDLLVLTTVAVAGLRVARRRPQARLPRVAWTLLMLLGASYAVAAVRGVMPLPAFDANALQNYLSPWNALNIAKGFAWPMLLLPILTRTCGPSGEELARRFFPGVIAGLAGVCAVAILERASFPGLMDFASDYRTTASFSGMHTGGAALDGFLALTLPAALWLLFPGHRLRVNLLGLALFACGTYVLFTTFSRGLYIGFAVGLALALWCLIRARPRTADWTGRPGLLVALGLLVCAGLWQVFASGGYRGLAAVGGFVALAFFWGGSGRVCQRALWIGAVLALGLALQLAAWGLVPKGAYWAYGLAALFATVLAGRELMLPAPASTALLTAGIALTGTGALLVAWHWGGGAALRDAAVVCLSVGAIAAANRGRAKPWWRNRRPTLLAGGAALLGLLLTIPIAGNYYSQERFSHVGGDLAVREKHWSDVLAAMGDDPATVALGEGLGRFPWVFMWANRAGEMPGAIQYAQDSDNRYVRLAGPRYAIGYGEVVRFGQRIGTLSGGKYRITASYRTRSADGRMDIEFCEKLLIYFRNSCSVHGFRTELADGGWHTVTLDVTVPPLGAAPWYLWRPVQFSLGNPVAGAAIDLDNIQATSAFDGELIRNQGFERGADFWFFTSDRHHLPWHAKNLLLGVFFDQGLLGLTAFGALVLVTAIRVARAAGSGNAEAAVLGAGLAGFLVVGLFDSLIDVPRIALLFYLFLLVSLLVARQPALARRVPGSGRPVSAEPGGPRQPAAQAARGESSLDGQKLPRLRLLSTRIEP